MLSLQEIKSLNQLSGIIRRMIMLGKGKLHTIELLSSKTLLDSYISYDEFVSVNNVLREYNEMKDQMYV